MKKMICVTAFCFATMMLFAQNQFSDFHIHITSKHFYNYFKNAEKILKDSADLDALRQRIGKINYLEYPGSITDMKKGRVSTYKNYFQADFHELRNSTGSVLCNSLYPYEKQFANHWFRQLLSSKVVSGIPRKRLKETGKESATSFNEFLAEYYFAIAQDTVHPVTGKKFFVAKNSEDLKKIVGKGDNAIVLSIEGGQVLYGPRLSSKAKVNRYEVDLDDMNEIAGNIRRLKNLEHQVFFITLTHFIDNRFAGHCKTIDRPGVTRRVLEFLSIFPGFHKSFFTKYGDGIHGELDVSRTGSTDFKIEPAPGLKADYIALPYVDDPVCYDGGYRAIRLLLEPDGRYGKPILIDVKHMDIRARFEYYELVEQIRRETGRKIPIIFGHGAVSGEARSVAFATALFPNFDKYRELFNPARYYKKQNRDSFYWNTFTRHLRSEDRVLYFGRDMVGHPFDKRYLKPDSLTGWFNPWGFNLADEEIKYIYDSEGIIGLNLDPRILGGSMIRYKKRKRHQYKKAFERATAAFNINKQQLSFKEYLQCEPLLRNIVYIVDKCPATDAVNAWKRIAIGSDMDGLIDPINIAPTAYNMGKLKQKMIPSLKVFWELNKQHFGRDVFFDKAITAEKAMDMFFYENGRDFMLTNF